MLSFSSLTEHSPSFPNSLASVNFYFSTADFYCLHGQQLGDSSLRAGPGLFSPYILSPDCSLYLGPLF